MAPTPPGPGRRELLVTAVALAAVGLPGPAGAAPQPPAQGPKPLPFDPTRLTGLSERLIRSHHENNYTGAWKKWTRAREGLAALPADADPWTRRGLHDAEAMARGSVVLHEVYFGHLGGSGKPGKPIQDALAADFGSLEAWEGAFRAAALGLAGGSGWALLTLDLHRGTLATAVLADHAHAPVAAVPLLALDMYEHSYHLDHGTQAARYVDAFFANLDWDVVEASLTRARRAHAALGG